MIKLSCPYGCKSLMELVGGSHVFCRLCQRLFSAFDVKIYWEGIGEIPLTRTMAEIWELTNPTLNECPDLITEHDKIRDRSYYRCPLCSRSFLSKEFADADYQRCWSEVLQIRKDRATTSVVEENKLSAYETLYSNKRSKSCSSHSG